MAFYLRTGHLPRRAKPADFGWRLRRARDALSAFGRPQPVTRPQRLLYCNAASAASHRCRSSSCAPLPPPPSSVSVAVGAETTPLVGCACRLLGARQRCACAASALHATTRAAAALAVASAACAARSACAARAEAAVPRFLRGGGRVVASGAAMVLRHTCRGGGGGAWDTEARLAARKSKMEWVVCSPLG